MDVSLREPRASAPTFSKNQLDAVAIDLALNSIPIFNISSNPNINAKNRSIEFDAQDVMGQLNKIQQFKFAGGTQRVSVNISDGAGGRSNISGLYNGPSYTFGDGAVNFGTNIISEISALQEVRTDIYVSETGFKNDTGQVAKGSIPNRLKTILQTLIKNFETSLNSSSAVGLDREITIAQHRQNQKGLQIWYSILGASEDNTALIAESYLNLDQEIESHIKRIYLSNSSNFFNTILQFCSDFKLVYIPPSTDASAGRYGKLKGAGKIFEGSDSKNIKLVQFNGDLKGFNTPVVNSVWVTGTGNKGIKMGETAGTQIFATWPKTDKTKYSGRVQRVPPPPWVPNPSSLNINVDATPQTLRSIPAARVIDINNKGLTDLAKINFNIFTEWARLWFIDLLNANEVASIELPLDLSWQLGVYCKVSSESGFLFKGLVNSIRHNLSVRNASTTVDFSHVRYTA